MKISYTESEMSEYLKKNLTAEKYRHTLGVKNVAIKLAKRNNVNLYKTLVAALLHDAGKYNKDKDYRRILKSKLDKYEKKIPALWHNKLGEIIAKKKFGVKDKEVLGAIRKHSTADTRMSKLEKIIFIADIIEPNRKFKGIDNLRKTALKDLKVGFIKSLQGKIIHVLRKNVIIHPRSIKAWNTFV